MVRPRARGHGGAASVGSGAPGAARSARGGGQARPRRPNKFELISPGHRPHGAAESPPEIFTSRYTMVVTYARARSAESRGSTARLVGGSGVAAVIKPGTVREHLLAREAAVDARRRADRVREAGDQVEAGLHLDCVAQRLA